MDINKLVTETIDEFTRNIGNGKYRDPMLENMDPNQANDAGIIMLLMRYSETLLSKYHNELKEELAKSNINI
ncbi:hypothetical protein [uncultured Clostridium sp.]|uniref:hypothetical protein n=1 Tax=uncultured Clostridium sp. TaxID=59620 RepID=UPI0028EA4FFC|nr:hypothetical protein [uncultured Clostridium sp.]